MIQSDDTIFREYYANEGEWVSRKYQHLLPVAVSRYVIPMSSRHDGGNQIIELLDSIAWQESTDVTELQPLTEVVDTGALQGLLDAETDVSVTFEYLGYTVYLDSDGAVEID